MGAKPKESGKSVTRRSKTYSVELATLICDEVAKGHSLRDVCEDADMPSIWTFQRWLRGIGTDEKEREELQQQYARAMEDRCDLLAESALNAAVGASAENVQVARLDFDAKRWFLGKVAAKKYGDRVGLEHSGKDGGPLRVQVEVVGGSDE